MNDKARIFSEAVELFAAKNNTSCLDALEYMCEKKGIDYENVAPFISHSLKDKIAYEAQNLNFLPKVNHLPI